MTVKHKYGELELQELEQDLRDGYITKAEYELQKQRLKNYYKTSRPTDKREVLEDSEE